MADEVIKFVIDAKDGASKAFGSLAGAVARTGSAIKSTTKVVGAAGAAVVGFTTVIAASIDKQAKFATRIGVSVQALTAYQFVASQSGVSTEQFNMATQRMTRRVGEATKGLGEAQGALRELGIDAVSFSRLGVDKKMEVLADRLNNTASESDKLRLAFKLFDSEGTAVLQMLKGGSEQMRETAKDAEFLGLAISSQAAAQAELFTDKMGRATGALKGLSNSVAGELMPVITGLANQFADFVASNRENIAAAVSNAITGFFTIGEVASQAIDHIKQVFSDPAVFTQFVTGLADLGAKVLSASLSLGKLLAAGVWEGIKVVQDLFTGLGTWIGESLAQIVLGEQVTSPIAKFAEVFSESFAKARANMGLELEEMQAELNQTLPEIGSVLSNTFGIDLDLAREKAEETIASISLFAETTADTIGEATDRALTFAEQLNTAFSDFNLRLGQSTTEYIASLVATTEEAIQSLSDGLATAITTGSSLTDAFRNSAKQALQQVLSALIKLGIQRALISRTVTQAETSEATTGASKAVGLAGANMFASFAGAPWPISLGAPAAAAAAVAGASASFAGGAAAGAALGATVGAGAVFHGGVTNNPSEVSAIIRRDERVISPEQNRDLTDFLASGGTGVTISGGVNITMFPNATNLDGLRDIDPVALADTLSDAVLMALNNLDSRGVRPNFVERENF